MTPTQTLHQANVDFLAIHTEAPMDACARRRLLQVTQHTMRDVVDDLIFTVAKRKFTHEHCDYTTGMLSAERNQKKLIAACQTFLDKTATKHAELTQSHDELTCFTCRRNALMQTDDPFKHAKAWELQKGRNAEIVAYKALEAARQISADEQQALRWQWHCMHN